ncbi:helicase HerA-like domain-containing protein [Arachidicoccus sp.]|uniref:helicase HerA-like domain-containing protein n=1 Tax=Arachidicoccus sp. TaxID=1872624 RepID=UPI003D1CC188
MASSDQFLQVINAGYKFSTESVKIGVGMLNGRAVEGADVYLPIKMMNRHGLIAGATGTGKTKTLQVISEILSDESVPVLMLDIKGDLSGIAAAGTLNDKIRQRYQILHLDYKPAAFPVEFLTLSGEKGVRLRATVSEFGPILLSKILELNDTQGGLVAIIFKYCDDQKMPLLNLQDFIKVLQYIGDEGKDEIEKSYGKISTSSTGTILRKVVELEQQGAGTFFGEPSFEVADLVRIDDEGRGMINILRVTDLQSKPKLFSTFMLQMLDELYASSPEVGDQDKPKLLMFIDEAHLLFQEASESLLRQIETIIKLIRSKGIGIYFCTQNPQDIPAGILSQLGLKIQHALRAFTAADRKSIKLAAENFPETTYYKTDQLLTELGIGEALVTLLNDKGIPTPLVHTLLCSPRSRMDVLSEVEIDAVVAKSKLVKKYSQELDEQSAYEILTAKLQQAAQQTAADVAAAPQKKEGGILNNPILKSVVRTAAVTFTGYIARSLLGALGLGGRKR